MITASTRSRTLDALQGAVGSCVAVLADVFGGLVLGRASSWTMNGAKYGVRIHRLPQAEATLT